MNTITFTVLFLTFVAVSLQDDADPEAHKKKMIETFQACIQETGVDPELPKKALKNNEFPDDKNLKCFFKCTFQKIGRMDANGNLDLSKAMTHLPPNVNEVTATAALEKCKSVKGADACETAFLAAKCIREIVGPLPEHGH